MPHLHIEEFKRVTLPISSDGVTFSAVADNIATDCEKLILVEIDGREFFLLVKIMRDKILLKVDKISRPSTTYVIKKALNTYAKLASLKVLSSNVANIEESEHLDTKNALKDIRYFANTFPSVESLNIEVGFGSGRHLLFQAAANKETLFVGIEIHKPSIEQVLKQINIQKLDNVLLLDYDARLFLELVPSNLADRIFVHFPVPWDKKPHRRVISRAFVEQSCRALRVGGTLELRTDSDNYYEYALETFSCFEDCSVKIDKNREIDISSKYEDRWVRQSKNIYDITLKNTKESKNSDIYGDFSFEALETKREKMIKLNQKTIKWSDGFIHFERLYCFDDAELMFRLSLGSFERPEHLYLIVGDSVRYFPNEPVYSSVALKAHKKLIEVLNG